jgi:hypothetical protein
MKFLKPAILTTLLFFAFVSTILYTSCEKNACNNVVCHNGGSCSMGTCRCPTGVEGYQCQSLTSARYVGIYAGYSQCDNLASTYDTVTITTDNLPLNQVAVRMKSIKPKVLYGYIENNQSTYSIVVTNNDSSATYARIYTITLQDDKNLSIHAYDHTYVNPFNTNINKCTFTTNLKYK